MMMADLNFKKGMTDVNNIIRQSTKLPQVLRPSVVEIGTIIKGIDKQIAKTGVLNKKLLGMGLGMTFFMFGIQMQLKRMMRQMFTVWESAQLQTSGLLDKFNMMRASLGAISIAFFDALAQSGLFDSLLNMIVSATNWFLDLSDATRAWIAEFFVKTLFLMIGISFLGQTALALNTLLSFFGDVKSGWDKTFASAGTILTIGLAVASIEDFLKGDVIDGIINTAATIVAGYATMGIVKGKKGMGWLFALAIGLHLVGENRFFSSILGMLGLAFGILSGFAEAFVSQVVVAFKMAFNAVLAFAQSKGLFKGTTPFEINPAEYDYGAIIARSAKGWFQVGYQKGMDWDKKIQSWKDEMEGGLGTGGVSNKPVKVEIVNGYTDYRTPNPFGSPII